MINQQTKEEEIQEISQTFSKRLEDNLERIAPLLKQLQDEDETNGVRFNPIEIATALSVKIFDEVPVTQEMQEEMGILIYNLIEKDKENALNIIAAIICSSWGILTVLSDEKIVEVHKKYENN